MADAAFAPHDHSACKTRGLARAEALCAARKVRLTPVRRKALEILFESHEAMGAYDVLAKLDAAGFGDKPPVAYRALGFLIEQGLAHKIERLNAYVACAHSGEAHHPAFLICRSCKHVAEAELQGQIVGPKGFVIESEVVEALGLCPACQEAA